MSAVTDNSFESIFSELLSKSNLTPEDLTGLIQQKKSDVGGGYLTDQGALFLVAADLKIDVNYDNEKPTSLAHILKDQNSLTVTGRILSVGCPRTFTRKADSQRGLLSRVVIYDNSASISVSLWDRAVTSFFERADVGPGDLIKISNAYTRSAIDGSISLSAGEKAVFEKIASDKISSIPNLENKITPLSVIPENGRMLIIRGRVDGETRKTSFTRSDGISSELTSFTICDSEDLQLKYRVVIWGNSNPTLSSLKDSEVVTLLNVRTKLSNFQNSIATEIHGDETTCILERWEETKSWMKELARNASLFHLDEQSANASSVTREMPFVARILSIRKSDDARVFLLVVDSQKRKISVVVSGDAVKDTSQLVKDDVVVCKPETFDSAGLKATIAKEKSIVKSNSKRADIPVSTSLLSRVENLEQTGIVSLELMCLTDPVGREIQTKDGLVRRTEVTVADHTGEIKVYGWRNLSKLLENCSAGDRITLAAVEVQVHESKKFLVLKNYSGVTELTT
ncbi:MAG: hypothetical protein ACYCPW_02260 [Nitrososphaerales archaeon]